METESWSVNCGTARRKGRKQLRRTYRHRATSRLYIPVNGVVRNGDGSFTAWVTTDRRHFTERAVQLGEPLDGEYPVSRGLKRGELAVVDGAVFLSNILFAPPTD